MLRGLNADAKWLDGHAWMNPRTTDLKCALFRLTCVSGLRNFLGGHPCPGGFNALELESRRPEFRCCFWLNEFRQQATPSPAVAVLYLSLAQVREDRTWTSILQCHDPALVALLDRRRVILKRMLRLPQRTQRDLSAALVISQRERFRACASCFAPQPQLRDLGLPRQEGEMEARRDASMGVLQTDAQRSETATRPAVAGQSAGHLAAQGQDNAAHPEPRHLGGVGRSAKRDLSLTTGSVAEAAVDPAAAADGEVSEGSRPSKRVSRMKPMGEASAPEPGLPATGDNNEVRSQSSFAATAAAAVAAAVATTSAAAVATTSAAAAAAAAGRPAVGAREVGSKEVADRAAVSNGSAALSKAQAHQLASADRRCYFDQQRFSLVIRGDSYSNQDFGHQATCGLRALGCPNTSNPYHLCTPYCEHRFGLGAPVALLCPEQMEFSALSERHQQIAFRRESEQDLNQFLADVVVLRGRVAGQLAQLNSLAGSSAR